MAGQTLEALVLGMELAHHEIEWICCRLIWPNPDNVSDIGQSQVGLANLILRLHQASFYCGNRP